MGVIQYPEKGKKKKKAGKILIAVLMSESWIPDIL